MADTKETNTTVENNTTTESNTTTDSNTTSNTESNTTTTTPSGEPITIDATIKLYIATFGRVGDANGLKYWANIENDTGKVSGFTTMEQIASSFFDQPETKALYEGKSNEALIKAIYLNVLGREGEQAGIDYWTGELDKGHFTRGEAILAIINGTKGTDATLLNNKLEVGKAYYDAGLNDAEFAKTVIKDVTSDPKSVDAAKLLIDHYGKLYLTAGTDILNGTIHDDTVLETNAKDDLQNDDRIIDASNDDNDTLTATVTSDTLSPTIQNIENIKIIGEYISTGLNLNKVSGTKVLTLDTKIAEGTATVKNENAYAVGSIVAGTNISTLKVSSADSGTKSNISIDAGSANVELSGYSSKTDKYTVSLAKDKKITLSSYLNDADDTVIINAKGDFEIDNGNSGNDELLLTINNASSSAITVTSENTAQLAKHLTLSGNDIIIDVRNGKLLNISKFTSTATKSTIEIVSTATAGSYDLHQLSVTEVNVLKNMGVDNNITVNGASIVNLSAKDGNTTIDFYNTDVSTLNINVTKNQEGIRIGNNVKQILIQLNPTSDDNTTASNQITIDTIDINDTAGEKLIVNTTDKDLLVKELNISQKSTSYNDKFEFISTMTTGSLTLNGVNKAAAKIVGGAGNDKITGSSNDDEINGGAGNDTLKGQAGDDTIKGGAGNDTIYGGTGSDTIETDDGQDVVVVAEGEGNDTIKDFKKGTDTLVVIGDATGKTDLANLSPNGNEYTLLNDTKVTLTNVTATDLSDSIQLGKSGSPFNANNGDVIGGAKDDVIKADINYSITLKGGNNAVIISSGDANVTVTDFSTSDDKVILVNNNLASDINETLNLSSVTVNDNNYTFYNNDFNVTLTNVEKTDAKGFVQLGYDINHYFTVDGNVTAGKFNDFINLKAVDETHVVNFIDDGGFDSIKFDGNGTHNLSFDLISGINVKKGEAKKPSAKVTDATDGKAYIISSDTFSCKLGTAYSNANNSYTASSFTAEVAKCINLALGTSGTEKYVTIIQTDTNIIGGVSGDSLIYLTNGNDSGVQASDLSLIGIIVDSDISEDNISTHTTN